MERTIVGVFDSEDQARAVERQVIECGIAREHVHVRGGSLDDERGAKMAEPAIQKTGFLERLFGGLGADESHAEQYEESVRRGSCVVVIDEVEEDRAGQLTEIMAKQGAIDIDERVAQWRAQGWTPGRQDAGTRAETTSGRQRIPVIEEQLSVGKRTVERGGVRVYTRVTERPVEEEVTLREERAHIERHAVDRPATEADLGEAFKERSVELRETAEEAVVSKTAHVVEEVEIGTETAERTEKVSDKVRRSDVEIEDLPGSRTGTKGMKDVHKRP